MDAAGGGTRAATTIRHVAVKVRWFTGIYMYTYVYIHNMYIYATHTPIPFPHNKTQRYQVPDNYLARKNVLEDVIAAHSQGGRVMVFTQVGAFSFFVCWLVG